MSYNLDFYFTEKQISGRSGTPLQRSWNASIQSRPGRHVQSTSSSAGPPVAPQLESPSGSPLTVKGCISER